jgi:hypothetical protein
VTACEKIVSSLDNSLAINKDNSSLFTSLITWDVRFLHILSGWNFHAENRVAMKRGRDSLFHFQLIKLVPSLHPPCFRDLCKTACVWVVFACCYASHIKHNFLCHWRTLKAGMRKNKQ